MATPLIGISSMATRAVLAELLDAWHAGGGQPARIQLFQHNIFLGSLEFELEEAVRLLRQQAEVHAQARKAAKPVAER